MGKKWLQLSRYKLTFLRSERTDRRPAPWRDFHRKENMKQYELVVLLHPDLEIDVDAPIAKLEKLVEAANGKVIKRDNWGKKRLAYPVNHHSFAVYVAFTVQIDPKDVRRLENTVLLSEEVIRHLLVSKIESSKTQPAKPRVPKTTTNEKKDEKPAVTEEVTSG